MDTDTHTRRMPCDMKVEMRMIQIQAKGQKRLPSSQQNPRERHRTDLP